MYFGNQRAKKCPLCKQNIELKELKKNEVISDVENILNKVESHKNKIEELELLIKEKKNSWENQANNINSILNRIFKYQDMLKAYKKEYQIFLVNCQDVVQNTFEKYLKKTEEITQNLLNYNKLASQSIIIYNNMSKRKKDEKNIKDLINEIVNMERKHFNNKNQSHDEITKFLNAPIKMIPIINQYYVKEITLTEKDIKEYTKISRKGIHYKIGDFQIVYTLNINEGYKVICEFSFKVKNGMNACFLASQTKTEKNSEQTLYPMQLVKHENNKFIYECYIPIDGYELGPNKWIKLKTDVLAFYM
jgi:small-conductance mechanosensitive channel